MAMMSETPPLGACCMQSEKAVDAICYERQPLDELSSSNLFCGTTSVWALQALELLNDLKENYNITEADDRLVMADMWRRR